MTLSPVFYRGWHGFSTLIATIFIAGCAINTEPTTEIGTSITRNSVDATDFSRQGRIAIRVDSDPPQSLSGTFIINGNAQYGDLSLSTPLGSVLAQLSWTPEQALLKTNNATRRFDSTDALMMEVTGTVLPLNALFEWLAGQDAATTGWQVDLTQMNSLGNQRLNAKRTDPLPRVELRLVLDK